MTSPNYCSKLGDKKGAGLAGIETGSECYMSEMLDFEYDDGEEADETTEEDLVHLKDVVAEMDLVVIIGFMQSMTVLSHRKC